MDSIIVSPDLEFAKKKYEAIMELVNDGELVPHYPNTVGGHLVGRMGEDAVYEYMKTKGFKPFPRYRVGDSGCDIFLQTTRHRLEVKTWREDFYEWGGRAISVKQLPLVRKKCDRIIWCSVKMATKEVFIKGWSQVADFNTAPLVTKGKLNLQSYQLDVVRDMSTFPDVGISPNLQRTSVLV